MRNSFHTRMIAWIIAVIMVLCMVPVTSMANIIEPNYGEYEDEYVINDYAVWSVYYKDQDGTYKTPPARGQEYTLVLTANDTELARFPEEGELIFYLPEKVSTVSEITGTNVSSAEQSGNAIKFTLSDTSTGSFIANIKFTTASNVYDLYNIALIKGTYYRLRKTTIRTDKELSKKNFGTYLNAEDYEMPAYDFENQVITINDKEYYYQCDANADKIAAGGKYYTVQFDNLNVLGNKIGAVNKTTGVPNWAIPEAQRYDDPNETDSFHANYTITLYDDPFVQTLYNMLKVDKSDDYYRLKKTSVYARDARDFKDNEILKEYTLIPNEQYDFTGVTIELNGEVYEYSDKELTGDYYSYYTVKPDKIWKKSRINGNEEWYLNPKGFLDGSEAEYTEINETIGFHRDYIATTHKGTIQRPDLTVKIENSVAHQDKVYSGTEVTLTAVRGGSYTGPVTTTWIRIDPETNTEEIISEATDQDEYKFIINADNARYTYKVILTPKK